MRDSNDQHARSDEVMGRDRQPDGAAEYAADAGFGDRGYGDRGGIGDQGTYPDTDRERDTEHGAATAPGGGGDAGEADQTEGPASGGYADQADYSDERQ